MSEKLKINGRLKAAVVLGLLIAASFLVSPAERSQASSSETYVLVQAIGNTEKVSAKGLSKPECESRKAELKKAATALETFNESAGYGSITCLPESDF